MTPPIDLVAARERLGAASGKQYWRSLEELADEPGFREMLHREFPRQASEWTDGISRRHFLSLMGASLALAGLSGCAQRPAETIVPYVRQPEELLPGKPLFYATAMTLAGYASGLLIESHEGRPTKAEGNPQHPISQGATDIAAQASLLTLYDPDRSQTVSYKGQIRNWAAAVSALRARLQQGDGKGNGFCILTEAVGSPTLAAQLEEFLGKERYPEAKWYQYEPTAADNALAGARLVFDRPVHTTYRLSKADVVVALDADFLSCGPGHLLYTRDFAARRRRADNTAKMNRLYVVECTPTPTGASADNRLPLRASEVDGFARALAGHLGVAGVPPAKLGGEAGRWAAVVADDLKSQPRGRTLIVPGDGQPPAVHALAHAMNAHLGNIGETVVLTEPVLARPTDNLESLTDLVNALVNDEVDTLLIFGGNPAYTAPADVRFGERLLEKARKSGPLFVHLGAYFAETSECCHWHIPEAHYLESWSDGRAVDGTASVIQPLIAPLYAGRSAHELLSALVGQEDRSAYTLVRETWRKHWEHSGSSGDFEKYWRRILHDGIVAGTASPAASPALRSDWWKQLPPVTAVSSGMELVFAPDPVLFDGRFANNGWLQELPKPLTKITWDNVALMSPRTARELGVGTRTLQSGGGEHGGAHSDVIRLRVGTKERARELEAPIWIAPGHADNAITLHLGYGRDRAGRIGGHREEPVGVNANRLRTTKQPWLAPGVEVTRTGTQVVVACVQGHHNIEQEKDILRARRIIRSATLPEYEENPAFAAGNEGHGHGHEAKGHGGRTELPTLYPADHPYLGHKWAMAIDMTTCVGCSACVVACQAENNIPVVGKQEVVNGREMHWLRIDRYWEGSPDNPSVYFQPLPCMHCENAPCEQVCPVEATVHSDEGTNDMVYNRCVGTRYCSNNCPYKVRRFNFFFYAQSIYETPSLKLLQNPDVTVRSRGVMEKCSYCIQRINFARTEAEKEAVREKEAARRAKNHLPPDAADLRIEGGGRSRLDPARPGVAVIFDGEIVTACQAACPAEAIVFGDLNDPGSRIAKLNQSPLNYRLLNEDLNTQPRTSYLAAVRNPNPALAEKG
jgi:molybdopterin-containing oxidoreductase family iron-sulfur binding subunit